MPYGRVLYPSRLNAIFTIEVWANKSYKYRADPAELNCHNLQSWKMSNETISECQNSVYELIQTDESTVIITVNWIFTLIVRILACPSTVLLNVLVIAAVKRRPRLQNNANILLACLAGVDALTGVVMQPLLIASTIIDLRETEGQNRCLLFGLTVGVFHIVCLSSIFHLTLVTFERFIAIKYTLNYVRIITKESIRIAVVLIWILTVLMELVKFGVTSHSQEAPIYFSAVIALMMVCCVVFIVSCHIMLFRETSRHRKKIMTEQIPQEEVRRYLTENKLLKTTAYVLGAVLLCYLPLALFMLVIMQLRVLLDLIPILRPWVPTCAALNSLLNPFIYCWRQVEMRKFIFRNPFSARAVRPG